MCTCWERPEKRKGDLITPGLATAEAQRATDRAMNEGLKRLVENYRADMDRLADAGYPVSRL